MVAFRFIAWACLALAFALLGADAVSSLEAGVPHMRTTADILMLFHLDSSGWADAAPGGISNALSTILGLPLWGVLGPIGIVLTLVFRPID